MPRFFAFFVALLVASGLVLGSTAHAYEAAACIAPCGVADGGQEIGEADQSPAKPSKCPPGHCCGCHGHHVGMTVTPKPLPEVEQVRVTLFSWLIERHASGVLDSALRPPQA